MGAGTAPLRVQSVEGLAIALIIHSLEGLAIALLIQSLDPLQTGNGKLYRDWIPHRVIYMALRWSA